MDTSNIGQGRQFAAPEHAYDAMAGKYMDPLPSMPTEAKLPTSQLPMCPPPMPYVMMGTGTGER